MIKTPICDLLGIEYPIFQGGMAWISDGKLAAAVSNGGGLGIISAMNANAEYLKKQIDLARSLTDKPFGVNIMLMSPFAEEVAQLVAQEIPDGAVLSLEVADSVIEARMTGRRTCHACGATYHVVMAPPKQEGLCDKCGGVLEQRKDDQPETVKHRLEIYHSQTEPLKGFYEEKGVLKRVPDLGGIEETNTKIMELLGK